MKRYKHRLTPKGPKKTAKKYRGMPGWEYRATKGFTKTPGFKCKAEPVRPGSIASMPGYNLASIAPLLMSSRKKMSAK